MLCGAQHKDIYAFMQTKFRLNNCSVEQIKQITENGYEESFRCLVHPIKPIFTHDVRHARPKKKSSVMMKKK